MKLHLPQDGGATMIENNFIDNYMPKANGEFVKLYLYLLRCAQAGRELSLSAIADVFDHTEKDVRRALAYWEKLSLLRLQYDTGGSLSEISFLDHSSVSGYGSGSAIPTAVGASSGLEETAAGIAEPEAPAAPARHQISRSRALALKEQEQIRQLIFVAEQYFSRPLTSTEQSNLLYFYDTLHFSADLIEYLIEYCVSKGSSSPHYMEKVAQEWYKEGITTVEQAKSSSNLYNKNYFTIFNAMGIKGRNPAPAEVEYMDRWLNQYDFTIEIILEACCRTIRQTHQPNFQYADKILEQWNKAGVHHLSDIQQLDAAHAQKKARPVKETPRSVQPNRFNNFPQREYNWSQLEQQLLYAQEKKEG